VWKVNSDYTLNKLHAAPAKKPFIAKSVRFCDRGEAVLIFLLESHEVTAYDIQPFRGEMVNYYPNPNRACYVFQ